MPVYVYLCKQGHQTVKLHAPMAKRKATVPCEKRGCDRRARRSIVAEQGGDCPQNRPYKPMLIHAAGKVMESRSECLDLERKMDAKGFVPCLSSCDGDE